MLRPGAGLPLPRLTVRDAAAEAVAGIVQRPGRAGLTMLGTVLGVGAFVAVLGLTATGAGQISRQFTVLRQRCFTPLPKQRKQRGQPAASFRWIQQLLSPAPEIPDY